MDEAELAEWEQHRLNREVAEEAELVAVVAEAAELVAELRQSYDELQRSDLILLLSLLV